MRQPITSSIETTRRYALRRLIVGALLVASLVPLGLLAAGAVVAYGRIIEADAAALRHAVVGAHARSIEATLDDRRRLLELLASTARPFELIDPRVLRQRLDSLNATSGGAFVDLGVIGADGAHLAYAGPFDLADRNYSEAPWFREVMASGVHISDAFLGFRGVPHIVIAVRARSNGDSWILRATLNSGTLDALVATAALGARGEAFLVNRDGFLQTAPRVGQVLDPSPLPTQAHTGVRDRRAVVHGVSTLVTSAWLNANRWQLVVLQDAAEVRAPVVRALTIGALLAALAVVVVVVTTTLATRRLGRQIEQANSQREEMSRAFLRSAKLASVGELATGLAHEINNPLAIIDAEQTNLADLLSDVVPDPAARSELQESIDRIKRQVRRCAAITSKMLQFGRQRESALEPTDLGPRVQTVVSLLQRQAGVRNVTLETDLAPESPAVMLDPVELEQVVVNLINNSFAAMPGGGRLTIRTRRIEGGVALEVSDTGQGMSPDVRERVFEPFFTTKPVGEGTGLGLSVCYGIVQSWGGRLELESEVGRGTTVRIVLPVGPAARGREASHERT